MFHYLEIIVVVSIALGALAGSVLMDYLFPGLSPYLLCPLKFVVSVGLMSPVAIIAEFSGPT